MKLTSLCCMLVIPTFSAALPAQSEGVVPVGSNDSPVIASLSARTTPDHALQRAIDIVQESQKARQTQERRHNMLPANQDRVVRNSDSDKILIMGGSTVIPM